jgi:hypothetical protein
LEYKNIFAIGTGFPVNLMIRGHQKEHPRQMAALKDQQHTITLMRKLMLFIPLTMLLELIVVCLMARANIGY